MQIDIITRGRPGPQGGSRGGGGVAAAAARFVAEARAEAPTVGASGFG